jgi:hypothetical protein
MAERILTIKQSTKKRKEIEADFGVIKKKFLEEESKYHEKIKELQSQCPHVWQTYASYDGTIYDCNICLATR